jgi:hypothetical protein
MSRKIVTVITAVCAAIAVLFSPLAAWAAVLFSYSNFSSTTGLTLIGNAATTTTTDGTVLRLTPAASTQAGAAYSTTAVALGSNATFSTQFQFRLTSPGGVDPADGITFVIANSPGGLGSSGFGMGYAGSSANSLAIEFDTYNNSIAAGGLGAFPAEPNSSNHVAIDIGGALTNTNATNVYGNASCGFAGGTPAQNPNTAPGCMSNGDLWTVKMSYDGAKLTITLSDPAEGSTFTAMNAYPINIASILGTNTAYVGFTASSGAGWENQDIVNWTFSNTATLTGPTGPASAPALSDWGLGGLALILAGTGALTIRRRPASCK